MSTLKELPTVPTTTAQPDLPDLRAVAAALAAGSPEQRARAVAGGLGWNSERAQVRWSPDRGSGNFVLAPYATGAGVVGLRTGRAEHDEFLRAWRQGYRWCLAVDRGRMHWCDLSRGRTWSVSAGMLSPQALVGLSPSSFVASGTFQPSDVGFIETDTLPRENPTQVLHGRLMGWWTETLRHAGTKKEGTTKDAFTKVVAAVLLLRTIEAAPVTERPGFAKLQSLQSIDDAEAAVRAAGAAFNSRVLRDVPLRALPFDIVQRIIKDTYEADLDFFDMDVDPVGRFYEEVLGDDPYVVPSRQRALIGPEHEAHHDTSQRRHHGVYFTPKVFADILAEHLVAPMARNAERAEELPKILDPAAGSGELLCAALRAIFAVDQWRTPGVAMRVLAEHIWAVDQEGRALQLAALNLLRTTVRMVPDILSCGMKFPCLESNLRKGDSLTAEALAALPKVDALLMNPPFGGSQRWRLPQNVTSAIASIPGNPNRALAHLCAGMEKVKEGGGIGAILPSDVLSGSKTAPWRAAFAAGASVDFIVENALIEFQSGMSARPGMVVARRLRNGDWRPRSRLVRLRFRAGFQDHDVAALLASANRPDSPVTAELLPAIEPDATTWTNAGQRATATAMSAGTTVTLKELAAPSRGFHQGVVPAPAGIGRESFLVRHGPDGTYRTAAGARVGSSSFFRPFANAGHLAPGVPVFCDAAAPDVAILLPESNGQHGVLISSLDDGARSMAEGLVDAASRVPGLVENRWAQQLRGGFLTFNAPKGFVSGRGAVLCMSKTTRGRVGQEAGIAVSTWIDTAGTAVPVDGVWARFESPEIALAVALALNSDRCAGELRARGSPRNRDTTEIVVDVLERLVVPDFRLPAFAPLLAEIMVAWDAYREACREKRPEDAYATPEYAHLRALGKRLLE